MKSHWFAIFLLLMLPMAANASFFSEDAPAPPISAAGETFEPIFSHPGALSSSVVNEIASGRKSIRVAARNFLSKPISEALVDARKNGRDVKVVLNKKTNTSPYSAAQFLLAMSLSPHLLTIEDGLYSDYILIDERDIILGNIAGFTDEEEEKKNNGNVLIIRNAPDLVKRYLADWQNLWAASVEMKEKKD